MTSLSSSVSSSAASLTALIMAHGLAATALADDAAPSSPGSSKSGDLIRLDPVVIADTKTQHLASSKFTAPLRDTPQTVAIIPSEVFVQQGATSLSDVLRNTAGITFTAGEGGSAANTGGDAFYLRGFDTSNNVFVDGVRDVGAYTRDVYNLEQVDIAKGPAGADIGRGGASGYVNLTTKVPRLERFESGAVTYGFDEHTAGSRRRTTLDLNEPLENSPLRGTAFRVNALWQDNDGVGRELANQKSWAIAPSLALGLGTPTRATFAYQHVEQDNLPDYGLPTAQLPGYLSPEPVPQVPRKTFYGFTADSDQVSGDSAVARFEHDFSADLTLTNQTRYSANQREAVVTVPGQNGTAYNPATGLLTRSRQANKRDLGILANQTNLAARFATGALRHNVSTGLELSRETAYSPGFANVTLPAIPIQQPDPHSAPPLTPARSGAYSDVTTKTAALYAFDTVQFNEHWQVTGGLRAERYRTHYLSVASGTASVLDARHSLVSWKSGLVFKPVRAGSLYAAYAVALTPPGTDFTLSSAVGNQNNPDTDPQHTSNLELGVKWDFFGGRLSTNAAVFKTVNDKTVYTDPVLGPIPAGQQTVQGLELGATRRITDNWLILASVAFLDSEINAGTTSGNNPTGASLPLIPKWSGSLHTSYRFASGFMLGGGGQYSAEVARRDNNSPAVPRTSPSYWLFNAFVSYPLGRNLTLRFNVNNLLDREFVQAANHNGARFNPGAPRAYLLTAAFRF